MAMAAALPDARRRLVDTSPVEALKARKNEAEVAGLVSAGRKDAAALCSYFAWLEAAASAASQPVAFAAAAPRPSVAALFRPQTLSRSRPTPYRSSSGGVAAHPPRS